MAISKEKIKKLKIKSKLEERKKETKENLKKSEENLDFGDDYGTAWEEEETDEAEAFSNFLGAERIMRHRINDIESALRKIEKGTYGECEKCDKDIEEKILKIDPESKLCLSCKKEMRKNK